MAIENDPDDPWQRILVEGASQHATATPIGSEMNGNSVVSRDETREKLTFGSDAVLPSFSILDPETAISAAIGSLRSSGVERSPVGRSEANYAPSETSPASVS